MLPTALRRLPWCREPSPNVPFLTSNSSSCGPRGEGQSTVPSGAPGQRIGQLSGGWTLSADATQTDDGSRAGKVSAVPSPALGAVQLRGGFCGRYSAGQPSVSLFWRWPSPRASRSWLWRTSWRVSSQGDHQEYPQRLGSPTD
ncbi:hypothetical protein MTO96_028891 [Rhipicephalus appendiculatus]